MLTTVQTHINDLTSYQIPEGWKLGGKGTAMKKLAGEIKVLFPTLNAEDKGLFVAALARGRFAINVEIWGMFLDAVGSAAPAPTPTSTPAPAPQTNKVAAEILECAKGHLVGLNLLDQAMGAQLLVLERQVEKIDTHNAILLDLVGMVSDLRKQLAEMKKPATKRALASV